MIEDLRHPSMVADPSLARVKLPLNKPAAFRSCLVPA